MSIPKYILKKIKPLKEISKSFKVKVYFGVCKKRYPFSQPYKDYIYVNIIRKNGTFCSIEEIYSIFFHELSHIFVYRDGKFPLANKEEYNSEEEKTKYRKIVVRFEKYVDKKGRILMKQWFPHLKYHKNYNTKETFKTLLEQAKNLSINLKH